MIFLQKANCILKQGIQHMISHRRKGFQFLLKDGESFQFLLKDGGRGFSFPLRKLKGIFTSFYKTEEGGFQLPLTIWRNGVLIFFQKTKGFSIPYRRRRFIFSQNYYFAEMELKQNQYSERNKNRTHFFNTVKETKTEHIFFY